MLDATEQERKDILDYMAGRAHDEVIELIQKVYSEKVGSISHDIWDVHTHCARWWVITNPTNLYSQEQFPNMDLALTFHVGLCLRIPRSERQSPSEMRAEPLLACWQALEEARETGTHAEEVQDFQAIGMRCREVLVTLMHVAQKLIETPETTSPPKMSDFRGWSEIIANTVLPGSTHSERRGLLKSTAESAWKFTNWLTHARNARFDDVGSALSTTELAVSMFTAALIRHIRNVPECCPSCGSSRLAPERGYNTAEPETIYERPVCQKCGWTGTPVVVIPSPIAPSDPPTPKGDCSFMNPPLRNWKRLEDGEP